MVLSPGGSPFFPFFDIGSKLFDVVVGVRGNSSEFPSSWLLLRVNLRISPVCALALRWDPVFRSAQQLTVPPWLQGLSLFPPSAGIGGLVEGWLAAPPVGGCAGGE